MSLDLTIYLIILNGFFFNTQRDLYDTLKTKVEVSVKGESKNNLVTDFNNSDSFLEIIKSKSNILKSNKKQIENSIFLNIIIITLVLISSIYLILYKK